MTPQEQQLVDELFDRLAQVENSPRDADAERVIANGVRRAPHATYALVQTALVMDEALKRANARIEELQAQVGDQPPPQQGGACGMADNGHDVTMTARVGSQNAKAILDIMVRDALDEAGKNFLRLIVGLVFHSLNSRNADSNGQRNS